VYLVREIECLIGFLKEDSEDGEEVTAWNVTWDGRDRRRMCDWFEMGDSGPLSNHGIGKITVSTKCVRSGYLINTKQVCLIIVLFFSFIIQGTGL
jgi:hypothetical protein